MHTGPLAFESTAAASTVFFVITIVAIVAVLWGRRAKYNLLFVIGAACMALYFGGLAVSAGKAPMVNREVLVLVVRELLLVASVFLASGVICYVGDMIRNGRVRPGTTYRLALVIVMMLIVIR